MPEHEIRHQKAFFGRLAGRYADGYGISLEFLRRVQSAVTPWVRGRVLDVGNGGLLGFDPARADRVVVADLSAAAIRTVKRVDAAGIRSLHASEATKVRCVEADVMALPFRAADFDVVVMCYVAHHLSVRTRRGSLANIDRALAEVRRVLRPGGTLVLVENCPTAVPKCVQDGGFRFWSAAARACGKPLPYFMSRRQIERGLGGHGFRIAREERIAWDRRVHQPMFPSIAPAGWLWELLLTNRVFVARRAGTASECNGAALRAETAAAVR